MDLKRHSQAVCRSAAGMAQAGKSERDARARMLQMSRQLERELNEDKENEVVTEKPAGASEAIDGSGTGEEPQQRHAPAGEGGAGGSETSTPAVSVGALPWEGTGRRAEWTVLRKEKRAPMVPWFVAPSKGVVEESV